WSASCAAAMSACICWTWRIIWLMSPPALAGGPPAPLRFGEDGMPGNYTGVPLPVATGTSTVPPTRRSSVAGHLFDARRVELRREQAHRIHRGCARRVRELGEVEHLVVGVRRTTALVVAAGPGRSRAAGGREVAEPAHRLEPELQHPPETFG